MTPFFLLFFLILATPNTVQATEIKRWTDQDGNLHYETQKPDTIYKGMSYKEAIAILGNPESMKFEINENTKETTRSAYFKNGSSLHFKNDILILFKN